MENSLAKSTRTLAMVMIFAVLSVFSMSAMAEKINLNTADALTMQYIPGVGASTAQNIIKARARLGTFNSMDEVDAIRGIGERTMIDIKKYGSINSGVSELTEEMKANPPSRSVLSAKNNSNEIGQTSS